MSNFDIIHNAVALIRTHCTYHHHWVANSLENRVDEWKKLESENADLKRQISIETKAKELATRQCMDRIGELQDLKRQLEIYKGFYRVVMEAARDPLPPTTATTPKSEPGEADRK